MRGHLLHQSAKLLQRGIKKLAEPFRGSDLLLLFCCCCCCAAVVCGGGCRGGHTNA